MHESLNYLNISLGYVSIIMRVTMIIREMIADRPMFTDIETYKNAFMTLGYLNFGGVRVIVFSGDCGCIS